MPRYRARGNWNRIDTMVCKQVSKHLYWLRTLQVNVEHITVLNKCSCHKLDTFCLILGSIKDFIFAHSFSQAKLRIPLGLPPSRKMAMNGVNGAQKSRFDPNLTPSVINAIGPNANPRLKQLISSLVQHLHDFCRENEVTIDEYMMGIDMVAYT